jgi:hypothetical protein
MPVSETDDEHVPIPISVIAIATREGVAAVIGSP